MGEREVFIVGEKESFLIRVLLKKLNESEIKAGFVKNGINTINAALAGGHENALLVSTWCR